MSFSDTFLEVIKQIEDYQSTTNPRELKVKEALLAAIDIEPTEPIADFVDRPFNFKYFAGELAWYLHRDPDIDYISHFSQFWKGLTNPDTNQVNSNYGKLVLNNQQLGWVIDSLVKDRETRQAIMLFNRPEFQFKGNRDFVCTLYANFFIRNNMLHMKVQMRSNDIFFGLTFDAPFFAFLQQTVHKILQETYPNLELGYYFHNADNIHFYERHFELVEKIKKTGPGAPYRLVLKKPLIQYHEGEVSLTDLGFDFLRRMDAIVARGGEGVQPDDYKLILQDYFEI